MPAALNNISVLSVRMWRGGLQTVEKEKRTSRWYSDCLNKKCSTTKYMVYERHTYNARSRIWIGTDDGVQFVLHITSRMQHSSNTVTFALPFLPIHIQYTAHSSDALFLLTPEVLALLSRRTNDGILCNS